MDAAIQNRARTDEELLALPDDMKKCEIIKGEFVVGPDGIEHEEIGVRLIIELGAYVHLHKLGIVCGSSAGYRMKRRSSFLSPDVSFVAGERLRGAKRSPKKFFDGAPDLAVEALSPSDTIDRLHEKIVEYFDNGARLIRALNPEEQTVLVYHAPQPDPLLRAADLLDGEDVVKGFSKPVSELFAELQF